MSKAPPVFSIVVPLLNASAYIRPCLSSIRDACGSSSAEIIIVDDGSDDGSLELAREILSDFPHARFLSNAGPRGPGAARNVGMDAASGEWLLFVDADDTLVSGALDTLAQELDDTPCDLNFFDWTDHEDSLKARTSTLNFGRRDLDDLLLGREEVVLRYLRFLIDPSVVYMAVRRSFQIDAGIRFRAGLHEDFDFTLECLLKANSWRPLNHVLYLKRARHGSVVHSISIDHLTGFAAAWRRALSLSVDLVQEAGPSGEDAVRSGTVALLATRAREIVRHARSRGEAYELLRALFDVFGVELDGVAPLVGPWTLYEQIAERLLVSRESGDVVRLVSDIERLNGMSWSCQDLQRSLFLRPDEIRTCCKRFFVEGAMRGDVALMKIEGREAPTPREVLKAKQALHRAINAGDETPCSGCPFLGLERWDPLGRLDVAYLSMEQHSVCNLRCSYCSDEYFGGKQARYDVRAFVEELGGSGALDACRIVVWGGGEPTVARDFSTMVSYIGSIAPSATQRFLTNSTRFSASVALMLERGEGQVVTSIDAGTVETFTAIRGRNRLDLVLQTLERYARTNPERVTVKYIFTDGNESFGEVRSFVELVSASEPLGRCYFQISADFKNELISRDVLEAAVQMYSGLRSIGVDFVYFDELLRQRLVGEDRETIASSVSDIGWPLALADPSDYDRVAIWGAGQLTGLLLQTRFIQDVSVAHLVDSMPAQQGSEVAGYSVEDPTVLLTSDIPVIPSAVQGFPLMIEDMQRHGISADRIIRDLIL